jgi:hypothetical protein
MTARAQLDPVSADKLTKILGLLGSNHAGEREAAAQAADRLVRGLGLTWSEVIAPPPPVPDQWQPLRYWRAGNSDWCRMAQFCHARRRSLNQRQRDFVESALTWRELSEKQKDWLTAIYAGLHRGAGR